MVWRRRVPGRESARVRVRVLVLVRPTSTVRYRWGRRVETWRRGVAVAVTVDEPATRRRWRAAGSSTSHVGEGGAASFVGGNGDGRRETSGAGHARNATPRRGGVVASPMATRGHGRMAAWLPRRQPVATTVQVLYLLYVQAQYWCRTCRPRPLTAVACALETDARPSGLPGGLDQRPTQRWRRL